MPYIYCITNKVNGKKYIGKTLYDPGKRFSEHLKDSSKRKCEKRPLYSAIKKYGKENFFLETLEECSRDILAEREVYWINKYNTYKFGYNATKGGDGKLLIDEKEVLESYEKYRRASAVAKHINRDLKQIRHILKENGVSLTSNSYKYCKKKVYQYTKEGVLLGSFDSTSDAARYLFENGIVKNTKNGVRGHISDSANGKVRSAYGFLWKY